MLLVLIDKNWGCGNISMLAFFDDKLKTFRNKNQRFICNVEKIK